MNGWKYEWVDELPRHVYSVLVASLNRDARPTTPTTVP
jgi:hypothetical protein